MRRFAAGGCWPVSCTRPRKVGSASGKLRRRRFLNATQEAYRQTVRALASLEGEHVLQLVPRGVGRCCKSGKPRSKPCWPTAAKWKSCETGAQSWPAQRCGWRPFCIASNSAATELVDAANHRGGHRDCAIPNSACRSRPEDDAGRRRNGRRRRPLLAAVDQTPRMPRIQQTRRPPTRQAAISQGGRSRRPALSRIGAAGIHPGEACGSRRPRPSPVANVTKSTRRLSQGEKRQKRSQNPRNSPREAETGNCENSGSALTPVRERATAWR